MDKAAERYRRCANYLAAAQLYLRANPLLEEPLRPEHLKPRLLGHWGTAPGINLIYQHLNRLILRSDAELLLVTGPGHGAAANLANLWLEGTLAEFYPELTRDRAGLTRLFQRFSWPGGFPSHLSPALPGVLCEGGELGYALATSFGAVLDNPDLIAACIVGDGEAETGPTAGSWHAAKFLSPAHDGAVLPILHLNGFKIANPTVFGCMDDGELDALFTGYGYTPRIVSLSQEIDAELTTALDASLAEIRAIQRSAREGQPPERARWPMIVLRTPKGWTGPREIDGVQIEGTFRAHQVPAKLARTNPAHRAALESWLRSYRPDELFDREGRPAPDIVEQCPRGARRMAMNPHGFGWRVRRPLALPPLSEFGVAVARRGDPIASAMEALGRYLREVVVLDRERKTFRIVCPDELESNRLGAVLEVTSRQFDWPPLPGSEGLAREGRVLEVLSEHLCQGWLQGYLLTGRHGLFPCYEAFLPIVDGMMNQYAKFLKSSREVPWRGSISSLNYVLTSEAWRQEHNGYSHQGPGFLNNLLTKKGHTYRIYLPPDANCLLWTMNQCLSTPDRIHLVVAGKQPMPQWLGREEAADHCRVGASIWRWASTFDGEDPELVLAGCGDSLTLEVMAAAQILREEAPGWRVRVVNVTDLLVLGIPEKYPGGLTNERFERLFPRGVPALVNFHGYTAAIKQLCWERPEPSRFDVNGYREEGTTTTPFMMQILNRTSRYHLVMQAAQKVARVNPSAAAHAEALVVRYERKIAELADYVVREGEDPPEISGFRWTP